MKDKKILKHYKPAELREFIKKYRINIPLLARNSGINESVFRNKLYQSQPSYFFTPEEYLDVLTALLDYSNDIMRMVRQSVTEESLKKCGKNIEKKSEKSDTTPILKY